jgi:hypothetical protein
MSEVYIFEQDGAYTGFTPTLFSTTVAGILCIPAIISRSSMKITDNFAKSTLTFTFDSLNSFANNLLQNIPEKPILIVIYKDGVITWRGQVLAASRRSIAVIEVACDSSYTLDVKAGVRYRANLHCNHTLYSSQCGVNEALWAFSAGVITATSTLLTVSGLVQPNGYFNNGKATLNGQTRQIVEQANGFITLSTPFLGVQHGLLVLYPGCALTEVSCIAFNNIENGLMFPRMPSQNPFGNQGLL